MADLVDTLVVGGGLAGAFAALALSTHERVHVVDAHAPAAGASAIPAGMVTPLIALRARPAWRAAEALEALQAVLVQAAANGLFQRSGVLRPARDPEQRRYFQQSARTWPHWGQWWPPAVVAERFPDVHAPAGALYLPQGGVIQIPNLVQAVLETARRQGATVQPHTRVIGWGESDHQAHVDIRRDGQEGRLFARRVLLCLGNGFTDHPELARLSLHAIKGQVVVLATPEGLDALPPLSGGCYIAPIPGKLVLGSSYEHTFTHLAPSPEQTHRLLQAAARMVPALAEAPVLAEVVGVRATVPHLRLPMLGPLPGRSRLWVFTDLGSKGLLMAPLLAQHLTAYFHNPEALPPEIRVRPAL